MQNACSLFSMHFELTSPAASYTTAIPTHSKPNKLRRVDDSGSTKHSRSEQVEFSAAEHLAFDHLQAIAVTFYLPITPF
jgi:hypothetical protein